MISDGWPLIRIAARSWPARYDRTMHADPNVEPALDHLHAHNRADLRFDEHFESIKYVIAPDGRLAAPVMVAMLSAAETVLFVPEDREGCMELMVTLEEFDEAGEHGSLADRWRIYHGDPPDVRWAIMTIDAARFKGLFIDGEAFAESNPLAAGEAALCRDINQRHTDALRRLSEERGGMRIEQPVLVGVDPRGINVRAAFDIVRVRFARQAKSIDDVKDMITGA